MTPSAWYVPAVTFPLKCVLNLIVLTISASVKMAYSGLFLTTKWGHKSIWRKERNNYVPWTELKLTDVSGLDSVFSLTDPVGGGATTSCHLPVCWQHVKFNWDPPSLLSTSTPQNQLNSHNCETDWPRKQQNKNFPQNLGKNLTNSGSFYSNILLIRHQGFVFKDFWNPSG